MWIHENYWFKTTTISKLYNLYILLLVSTERTVSIKTIEGYVRVQYDTTRQVDERVSMTKQKNDSGTIKGICMKFKPGHCGQKLEPGNQIFGICQFKDITLEPNCAANKILKKISNDLQYQNLSY